MILATKLNKIIEISESARLIFSNSSSATTAYDDLQEILSELPARADIARELENCLSELRDDEIFHLLYLYLLGKEWVDKNDPEKLAEKRKWAYNEARAITDTDYGEAISYLVRNITRISKYVINGRSLS